MYGYERLSSLENDADFETVEKLDPRSGIITHQKRVTKAWTNAQRAVLAVQAVILLVNIFLVVWNISWQPERNIEQPFSPVRSSVRYSIDQSDTYNMHSSPFIGEPRLELDQAWSSLLQFTNIRISEDEMRIMNKTSVALKDGDGYLGYLEVHHMLHCLKRFKQFRHLEHYPEIDPSTYDLPHWDHCIEVIRRGIMCNADLMIDTLEWNEDGSYLNGVNRYPRVCADWNSIQEFAAARTVEVDHFDPLEKFWPSNDLRSVGPPDLAGSQQ